MSFNIEVEGGKSVRLLTAGKYCDRDIVVTAMGGDGGSYDQGYADGKQDEYDRLVDETKIIEKTVSGSVIHVDDVSEIPHKCTVSVDKDTTVTVCGKNLCTIDSVELKGVSDYTVIWSGSLSAPFAISADFSQATEPVNGATFIELTIDGKITSVSAQNCNDPGRTIFLKGTITEIQLANWCQISGVVKFQLEAGTVATSYEPYKGQITYPITVGQPIEVDSICPTMTLLADNDATITLDYHKSYGAQAEHGRFWDVYLQNGQRTNYANAFCGIGWTDDTFTPTRKINVHGDAQNMFYMSQITELTDDIVDFSNMTNGYCLFKDCSNLVTLPRVDLSNANLYQTYIIGLCGKLTTIGCLVFSEKTKLEANSFYQNSSLVNVTFEGVIATPINLMWSLRLSNDTVQSLIDHLKDLTGATAQTITFHADVGAKLTDEQKAIITAKNWNVSY